jgi:hypothetical protein
MDKYEALMEYQFAEGSEILGQKHAQVPFYPPLYHMDLPCD